MRCAIGDSAPRPRRLELLLLTTSRRSTGALRRGRHSEGRWRKASLWGFDMSVLGHSGSARIDPRSRGGGEESGEQIVGHFCRRSHCDPYRAKPRSLVRKRRDRCPQPKLEGQQRVLVSPDEQPVRGGRGRDAGFTRGEIELPQQDNSLQRTSRTASTRTPTAVLPSTATRLPIWSALAAGARTSPAVPERHAVQFFIAPPLPSSLGAGRPPVTASPGRWRRRRRSQVPLCLKIAEKLDDEV
jgi:hypothetical protein